MLNLVSIEEARLRSREGVLRAVFDRRAGEYVEKFFATWVIYWRPGGREEAVITPAS